MIKTLDDVLQKAKDLETKKIAVACAQDEHVLEAIIEAKRDNIVDPILIGDESKISSILKSLKADAKDFEIINSTDLQESCAIAVKLVSDKKADCLMKGLVDTKIILKEVLNKEYGLRTDSLLSHVAVIQVPSYDKLIITSDAAMNLAPSVDDKEKIINNTLSVTKGLGIKAPNVGLVCAVEKVNDKMQATLDAQELCNRFKDRKDAVVGGPFALDNLVSKESAKAKGIDHKVAGNVDIIIHHTIEQANTFYKSLMFLAGGTTGGLIVGAQKPIVLTSRADSTKSKLYSIALAAVISNE